MRATRVYEHGGREYHANLLLHIGPAGEFFWVEEMFWHADEDQITSKYLTLDEIATLERHVEADIYAELLSELGFSAKRIEPGTRRAPCLQPAKTP